MAPALSIVSREARKLLKVISIYTVLGSALNFTIRVLDIRGAGNILRGDQSGFISDISFEMHHQILHRTIQKLKESEFKAGFIIQHIVEEKKWIKKT